MIFDNVVIKGTGKALPPLTFTNEDIVMWHGKKDPEWIYHRIGVKKRHSFYNYFTEKFLNIDEDDLAVKASHEALNKANLEVADLDSIIFATSAPTHQIFPDSSCTLHRSIEARPDTSALTVTCGCAGTLNGLMLGTSLIRSCQARNVLVVGASSMSSYFRPHLKEKIWLHSSIFGDGVSALVIGKDDSSNEEKGFAKFFMGADQLHDVAKKEWGGSKKPFEPLNYNFFLNDVLDIIFQEVPNNLKNKFTYVYNNVLEKANLNTDYIDWILFNMSNAIHQRKWVQEMMIEEEKAFFNMENLGNCAAASLGMSIYDFIKIKSPSSGDIALIMAVGTGLQYGGVLYRF